MYDKKEFAVYQEALTGTLRAMEKLGEITSFFLICNSFESIFLAVCEMQITVLAQQ